MVLAVAHPNPWASASFYLSSQSLADSRRNLHATSRSSHSRRSPSCRFLLSVASLSSASSCAAAAACRSLALASSLAFRRSSAHLAAYFGPSSLSSSHPRARTTLLTPTPIICRQVISLLRSTLVSDTCTSTDDVGAGLKERKQTQTRDRGGGQGPHLHEQDFGRTIRGTGEEVRLLVRLSCS